MKLDKEFIINSIKNLGYKHGISQSFNDVVVCCAYSFANSVEFKEEREKDYLRIINRYSKDERDLFPQILAALVETYEKSNCSIDVLGDIYESLGLSKSSKGQFFTPPKVCELMAKITIDPENAKKSIIENGYIAISDSSCGSGRNLYAVYDQLLNGGVDISKALFIGDDLDLVCCCISYIQLSLLGANAIIRHRDTLLLKEYDAFYTVSYMMNKDLKALFTKNDQNTKNEIEI